VALSGGVLHAHATWRPLSCLTDEEVRLLDSISKKLLPATPAQDGPHNQIESTTAIEGDCERPDAPPESSDTCSSLACWRFVACNAPSSLSAHSCNRRNPARTGNGPWRTLGRAPASLDDALEQAFLPLTPLCRLNFLSSKWAWAPCWQSHWQR